MTRSAAARTPDQRIGVEGAPDRQHQARRRVIRTATARRWRRRLIDYKPSSTILETIAVSNVGGAKREVFEVIRQSWANSPFAARSATRDTETDQTRLQSVARAIEQALKSAEAEHSGLKARIDDVLARAAITLGNGTDEYLTREPADIDLQNQFDRQIANGQLRLENLAQQIQAFAFLKVALQTRFPDFKSGSRQS